MIVTREDCRVRWLVDDMVMFSGIVSINGSVHFPTTQHSLVPNLSVQHQRLVMLGLI